MGGLEFSEIESLVSTHTARTVDLSASSIVLLMSALQQIEGFFNWRDNLQTLDATDWDVVENWIATAYSELMDEHECEETPLYQHATLFHQGSSGSRGGDAAADTWNVLPLNGIHSGGDAIITLTSGQFKPIAGRYKVTIFGHAYGGSHKLRLYNDTAPGVVDTGDSAAEGEMGYLVTYVNTDGTNWFEVHHYTDLAQATYGLGVKVDDGSVERWCTVELKRLGDVP